MRFGMNTESIWRYCRWLVIPSLFLLIVVLFLFGETALCAEQYDAKTLAKLNQQYWEKLQKIDLTYSSRQWGVGDALPPNFKKEDINNINPDDLPQEPYDDTLKFRWISGGGCEILHKFSSTSIEETPSGKVAYHHCLRYDGRYATEEWVRDDGKFSTPKSIVESVANSCSLVMIPFDDLDISRWFPRYNVFGTLFRSEKDGLLNKNLSQLLSSPGVSATQPIRTVDEQGDILALLEKIYIIICLRGCP